MASERDPPLSFELPALPWATPGTGPFFNGGAPPCDAAGFEEWAGGGTTLATSDVIDVIGAYLGLYGVSSWEDVLHRPRKDYSACRRAWRGNCSAG